MVDNRNENDLGIDTIGTNGTYVDVPIVRCDCRTNTLLFIFWNLKRLHYLQTIYIDTGVLVPASVPHCSYDIEFGAISVLSGRCVLCIISIQKYCFPDDNMD